MKLNELKIYTHYLTKNNCYKSNQKSKTRKLLLHSTGVGNPKLSRYVSDERTGLNKHNNDWDRPKPEGRSVCVHGFIGKCEVPGAGSGLFNTACVLTLPYALCAWGCGKGSKGSYNYQNKAIQIEICEPTDLTDLDYFLEVFGLAAQWFAMLAIQNNLNPLTDIENHASAHKKGYASNHADTDHWFRAINKAHNTNYNLDWFRKEVKAIMDAQLTQPEKPSETVTDANLPAVPFLVKTNQTPAPVLASPEADSKVNLSIYKPGVFTVVETRNGFGKLKSGSGWIDLNSGYYSVIKK